MLSIYHIWREADQLVHTSADEELNQGLPGVAQIQQLVRVELELGYCDPCTYILNEPPS